MESTATILVGQGAGEEKYGCSSGETSITRRPDGRELIGRHPGYHVRYGSTTKADQAHGTEYQRDGSSHTAGLAYGGGKLSAFGLSESQTHLGWTAGGGVEIGFTPNWLGR